MHHHPQLFLVFHHFVDEAGEVRKRTRRHAYVLAFFEGDLGLRLCRALLDLLSHPRDLFFRDRRRLLVSSDKARDLGSPAHDVPRLVIEIHPNQDVTRKELTL